MIEDIVLLTEPLMSKTRKKAGEFRSLSFLLWKQTIRTLGRPFVLSVLMVFFAVSCRKTPTSTCDTSDVAAYSGGTASQDDKFYVGAVKWTEGTTVKGCAVYVYNYINEDYENKDPLYEDRYKKFTLAGKVDCIKQVLENKENAQLLLNVDFKKSLGESYEEHTKTLEVPLSEDQYHEIMSKKILSISLKDRMDDVTIELPASRSPESSSTGTTAAGGEPEGQESAEVSTEAEPDASGVAGTEETTEAGFHFDHIMEIDVDLNKGDVEKELYNRFVVLAGFAGGNPDWGVFKTIDVDMATVSEVSDWGAWDADILAYINAQKGSTTQTGPDMLQMSRLPVWAALRSATKATLVGLAKSQSDDMLLTKGCSVTLSPNDDPSGHLVVSDESGCGDVAKADDAFLMVSNRVVAVKQGPLEAPNLPEWASQGLEETTLNWDDGLAAISGTPATGNGTNTTTDNTAGAGNEQRSFLGGGAGQIFQSVLEVVPDILQYKVNTNALNKGHSIEMAKLQNKDKADERDHTPTTTEVTQDSGETEAERQQREKEYQKLVADATAPINRELGLLEEKLRLAQQRRSSDGTASAGTPATNTCQP